MSRYKKSVFDGTEKSMFPKSHLHESEGYRYDKNVGLFCNVYSGPTSSHRHYGMICVDRDRSNEVHIDTDSSKRIYRLRVKLKTPPKKKGKKYEKQRNNHR